MKDVWTTLSLVFEDYTDGSEAGIEELTERFIAHLSSLVAEDAIRSYVIVNEESDD